MRYKLEVRGRNKAGFCHMIMKPYTADPSLSQDAADAWAMEKVKLMARLERIHQNYAGREKLNSFGAIQFEPYGVYRAEGDDLTPVWIKAKQAEIA